MTKKKAAKKKAKATKTTKATKEKGKNSKRNKKEFNPAEVRSDIAKMVGLEATNMAAAVIGEGKKGQLATVKYLLEMAAIYPASTDGSYATTEEDCLAKTLLDRLDLPDRPVGRDDEDEPRRANSWTGAAPIGTANVTEESALSGGRAEPEPDAGEDEETSKNISVGASDTVK
jgi:hypothetical protein